MWDDISEFMAEEIAQIAQMCRARNIPLTQELREPTFVELLDQLAGQAKDSDAA